MACSLCRLPFAPEDTRSWPALGMLSDDQIEYMKHVFATGTYIPGIVANMVYLKDENFMGKEPFPGDSVVSIFPGRVMIPMHLHCSVLFRHHAGLESNDSETIVELSLLNIFFGLAMSGANVGRLSCMDYEIDLEDNLPCVDMNIFWSEGPHADSHKFDWDEWKRRGLEWTAASANIFPRFEPRLTPDRLESAQQPVAETSDVLTTLPLDILRLILEHPSLPNESFVRLLGTCRTFRTHALTTFQPLARARVIALGWALPIPFEYAMLIRQLINECSLPDSTFPIVVISQVPIAHACSPMYGDWLLYLGRVLSMPNMRVRRWLWALAARLAAVRAERRAASEWEEVVDEDGKRVRSKAWLARAQRMSEVLETRGLSM